MDRRKIYPTVEYFAIITKAVGCAASWQQRCYFCRLVMDKNTKTSNKVENQIVLVVENEPLMRQSIEECLRAEGILCLAADSVKAAIAILDQENIALIILDWGLENSECDVSGAQVLRHARKIDPWIPVIVISGLPFDVRTDALVEQADSFLQKPFNYTLLKHQSARWLQRMKSRPQPILSNKPENIDSLEVIKRNYIQQAVALLNGNISCAAARLGIHRHTVAAALRNESHGSNNS